MADLLPLFLNLTGRTVLLVGGGPVAASKLGQLVAAGASVRVVAPELRDEIAALARSLDPRDRTAATPPRAPQITIEQRGFIPADLDGVWLVVAAATPEVNRQVADEAERRRLFVNAVDDPAHASAYLSGVVRRDGVTLAISTSGDAPALTSLLREGLDAILPRDLAGWVEQARLERGVWRKEGVPMQERKPRLLRALNALYAASVERPSFGQLGINSNGMAIEPIAGAAAVERGPRVPWLSGPEDSWL
jgi:uroporphyrin-III C-methyltransferase / precorrin-2 dehydrogenase / sirohydrochlorin ferrochelatase